jgi:hypothetical protein
LTNVFATKWNFSLALWARRTSASQLSCDGEVMDDVFFLYSISFFIFFFCLFLIFLFPHFLSPAPSFSYSFLFFLSSISSSYPSDVLKRISQRLLEDCRKIVNIQTKSLEKSNK